MSVSVRECWNEGEAQVIISYLGSHGIHAGLKMDGPHNIYPVTVDGMGRIQIVVPEESADRARDALAMMDAAQS